MSTKMQVKWVLGHAQTPKTRAQKRDRKKGRENMQNVSKNEPTDATKGTQNGAQGGHLGTPGVSKGIPKGTLGLCRAPQDLKRPSPVPREPPETLRDPIFNTFLHISLKSPLRSYFDLSRNSHRIVLRSCRSSHRYLPTLRRLPWQRRVAIRTRSRQRRHREHQIRVRYCTEISHHMAAKAHGKKRSTVHATRAQATTGRPPRPPCHPSTTAVVSKAFNE